MPTRWRKQAIYNEVILMLIRHRGEMLDEELYRNLSKIYEDFTPSSLMDILFRLEVKGIISVQRVKRKTYKISLRRNANVSKDIKAKIKS